MIDLKPCPFCGCQPKVRKTIRFPKWKKGAIEAYEAVCLNYECLIYNANEQYFSSEKAAALAWNRRAEGWIHIDDKLPEDYENILIFVNDLKSEPVQADVCYYDGDEAWLDSGYNFGSDVTYWMPLPKPPEVNENDEP